MSDYYEMLIGDLKDQIIELEEETAELKNRVAELARYNSSISSELNAPMLEF